MQLSNAEKIQILLHEYDALRNELISRHATQFQLVGIGVAVLVGVITLRANSVIGWCILLSLIAIEIVILFLTVVIWIDQLVFNAASRLQQIEIEVNAMAIAPRLLRWQSECASDAFMWKFLWRLFKNSS